MIQAVIMLGGLGLVIGVCLAAASQIFYVYVDPKVEAVDDALPGANCGGCGLPGCAANAEAIVEGKASPNSCVAGSEELGEIIASILGVALEAKEPDIASPGCIYSTDDAEIKFLYNGVNDCRAATMLKGGMKECNIGCLGLGTCVKVCPFDALSMSEYGLPVVDQEKCTGCGTCERECPKHIIKLSSVTRRIMREYTIDDCTTPCQRACPAGINIRDYIHSIAMGNYHKAVQIIKERNPFPSTIGRICPHPCEEECRRNLIDEPVAINNLKRFACDYEMDCGTRVLPYVAPSTHRNIAIIGGGVEGLSTAYFIARLGHSPIVFEATDKPGGILRKAIARERLSMDILDWDIQGILDIGVQLKTNMTAGVDFTIPSLLKDNYSAVFLATGGWDSRLSRGADKKIEETIPGTYLTIDLMKKNTDSEIVCDGNVVITGTTESSILAAQKCSDSGAKTVTIIFRESSDDVKLSPEKLEIANNKGFKLVYSTSINRILGEDKKLKELVCIDLESKETKIIPADMLFFSTGRYPELIFVKQDNEDDDQVIESQTESESLAGNALLWQAFPSYKKSSQYNEAGIFSKNDIITDYSAAIKAIGAARRSAASIQLAIYGNEVNLDDDVLKPDSIIQDVTSLNDVEPVKREVMPQRTPIELVDNPELEKGFTPEMANIESDRCLKCGLICYAQNKKDDYAA